MTSHRKGGCLMCRTNSSCIEHASAACECVFHQKKAKYDKYALELKVRREALKDRDFPNQQVWCMRHFAYIVQTIFTPQPLMAVGVLFSPMVSGWSGGRASGWVGGRREIVCPGCISETVRCRKLILGRDIG